MLQETNDQMKDIFSPSSGIELNSNKAHKV